MTAGDWRIDVRDKNRNRVGELDDYERLELNLKMNDVSTWRLTINRTNRLAADLLADGAGIVLYRDGVIFLSGFWVDQDHARSASANQVLLSGVDDTAWLTGRKASPVPTASGPPYSAQAADVRTQQASKTIREFVDWNAGPSAVATRRVPGLTIGGDPFVGPTTTGSGRWQKLLELCQEIAVASEAAGAPMTFKIVQTSSGGLQFRVLACQDKSSTVRFSIDLGNLASFSYKRSRPTMTYAVVGGNGEGTARAFYEKPDSAAIALWGRIEDDLIDARNGDSANELTQAADKALADGAAKTSLSITPLDLPEQRFGVHYNLGDKVTVLLDSVGPREETEVAVAVGQSTGATGYLVATNAAAMPFTDGSRVLLKDSSGHLKDPGVRVVTGQTPSGGNTQIAFTPAASAATAAGDQLVAVVAPATTGSPIVDIVREVNIVLTPDGGEQVTPLVGSTAAKLNPSKVFAVLRDMRHRMRNVERR